jgi:hypothetical protein
VASEPPVNMATAASPSRTRRKASPIATADEAQATVWLMLMPPRPSWIDRWALTALFMPITTDSGDRRSRPFCHGRL